MSGAPERIWTKPYYRLRASGYWRDAPIEPNRPENRGIEYIRADLPPSLPAALAVPEVAAAKRALERAEAAFADISEGEPERDDKAEIRFCKRRASEELKVVRAALRDLKEAGG